MTRLRTGVVGCGKVGALHAEALRRLPESEFVAVCDSSVDRAHGFAGQYGTQAFTNAGAMVREARVAAVCLCTPHPLHAEAAVQAMDAGAHVLVEKPLAANLVDCDLMIAAAKRNQVQLGVVSQRRFFEPVQRVKRAIEEGKLGKPVLGTVAMFSWRDEAYYRSDPWRGRWDTEGGGVLVNQSPHHLDLLQWFMGPVKEISGYAANLNHPYVEVEDTATATMRFRNGGLGSLVVSLSQKPGLWTKLHVHGSNGASVGVETDTGATFIAGMSGPGGPAFNDLWNIPGEEHLLEEFQAEDRARFAADRHPAERYHELQIGEFLDAIIGGRPVSVSGEEGRIVVEMFTAIYRSSRQGCAIALPLTL